MAANFNPRETQPRLDSLAVWLYIGLICIGLMNIYSATADVNQTFKFSLSSVAGRQLIWIGGAIILILTIAFANVTAIDYFAYAVYGIAIILNIAVIIVGKEVSGAKSWFGFGGVGIQPSEFAKLGTALAMAKFLGTYGIKFKGSRNILISLGIFILPMIIILLQNDTGSALVFMAFFLVLYREGLPGSILLAAVWFGILAATVIITEFKQINLVWVLGSILGLGLLVGYFSFRNRRLLIIIILTLVCSMGFVVLVKFAYTKILKNYQRDRIELVFGLKEDTKGMGYNLNQSKIAIGAGKIVGRGYLKGTQTKMGFVPEQHTDFIFCTIGEEWGFLGVLVFFGMYFGLLIRLINLSERQTSTFGRVMGYSTACILFVHVAINIGMTIGMVPVIGIPLPFVSFGGSSLWAFTILLFSFLKVDERRRVSY